MLYIWIALSAYIVTKIIIAILQLWDSWMFIRKAHGYTEICPSDNVLVYLVMPVLHEEPLIRSLYVQLYEFAKQLPWLRIVFVTTARERVGGKAIEPDTIDILLECLKSHPCSDQILHYHFPNAHEGLAEQLNFALVAIQQIQECAPDKAYVAVYNADSRLDLTALGWLHIFAASGFPVIQQSSLFLANIRPIIRDGSILAAANGFFQSNWSLQHEIPRFRFTKKKIIFRQLRDIIPVHCVGHGLLCQGRWKISPAGRSKTRPAEGLGSWRRSGFEGRMASGAEACAGRRV